MKFFRVDLADANRAQTEVWRRQVLANVPLAPFSMSAVGLDASLSTEKPEHEELLRMVLDQLCISYTVSDTQQVFTGWEGIV